MHSDRLYRRNETIHYVICHTSVAIICYIAHRFTRTVSNKDRGKPIAEKPTGQN